MNFEITYFIHGFDYFDKNFKTNDLIIYDFVWISKSIKIHKQKQLYYVFTLAVKFIWIGKNTY